jgi:glycosyltransferase involved in cell wall biosynthesis
VSRVQIPGEGTGTTLVPRDIVPPLRLTYIIGTYPRLTTTFIDREVEVLRELGVSLQLISIRRPARFLSVEQEALTSSVHYVLPASAGAVVWSHITLGVSRPRAYFGAFFGLLFRPHPTPTSRLRSLLHFGLGVHIAHLLRDRYPTDHIHAHFVDRASLVALIAGRLLGTPFSVTAHANDIYVDPALIVEKIGEAKFVATCTQYNESHLRAIARNGVQAQVRCIYHGIDLKRYALTDRPHRGRPLLLAVGQLKEKKGLRYLLEACRILQDRGFEFDCQIIGEGPLRLGLEEMIDRLSLRDHVALAGPLAQDAVMDKYREATIFVLPCITARDGDRDGIPNVILEAMAMSLPVVSTYHSGIPEAVKNGVTGYLVQPRDPEALSDALGDLLHDEELRVRMGRAGRLRVAEEFDADVNVKRLLSEFVA